MSEKFGVDLKYMTEIRQKIHSHPEGGFKEFVTQKLLKDVLINKIGLTDITECAKTGLVVNMKG